VQISLTHYGATIDSSPSSHPDVLEKCWRAVKVSRESSATPSPSCEVLLALNGGTRSHLAVTSAALAGVASACTPQRTAKPGKAQAPADAGG